MISLSLTARTARSFSMRETPYAFAAVSPTLFFSAKVETRPESLTTRSSTEALSSSFARPRRASSRSTSTFTVESEIRAASPGDAITGMAPAKTKTITINLIEKDVRFFNQVDGYRFGFGGRHTCDGITGRRGPYFGFDRESTC